MIVEFVCCETGGCREAAQSGKLKEFITERLPDLCWKAVAECEAKLYSRIKQTREEPTPFLIVLELPDQESWRDRPAMI
jgi:hypothetical protein